MVADAFLSAANGLINSHMVDMQNSLDLFMATPDSELHNADYQAMTVALEEFSGKCKKQARPGKGHQSEDKQASRQQSQQLMLLRQEVQACLSEVSDRRARRKGAHVLVV